MDQKERFTSDLDAFAFQCWSRTEVAQDRCPWTGESVQVQRAARPEGVLCLGRFAVVEQSGGADRQESTGQPGQRRDAKDATQEDVPSPCTVHLAPRGAQARQANDHAGEGNRKAAPDRIWMVRRQAPVWRRSHAG